MEKNNFDLGNILHISLAVKNIEAASKRIAEVFKVDPPTISDPGKSDDKYPVYYKGKKTEAYYKSCTMNIGNMAVDLLQPVGKPNSVSDFLSKNGNGVQHILFKVDDLSAGVETLKGEGLEVIEEGSFPGGKYAFLDFPEMGVAIELCQLDSK